MDKAASKTYAIWARNKLIEDTRQKAALLGITEEKILPMQQVGSDYLVEIPELSHTRTLSLTEAQERKSFVNRLNRKAQEEGLAAAFNHTVDEVAYTWFNRLVAIRYMEINDLLPGHMRLLSSVTPGQTEPDMVAHPFDSPLSFTQEEEDQILAWQRDSRTDAIFNLVFLKECNALHDLLPRLFEPVGDDSELLLSLSVMDSDGVVQHLVRDIPAEDWKDQVQIIGWLYQYYNTEPKQAVFDGLKKNKKITKHTIAPATQLFTPDWIVRYMVENSLGRFWLSAHPDDELQKKWKYYLPEAEQEPEVKEKEKAIAAERKQLPAEKIGLIDPCAGSGHILTYAFDVFMDIYRSKGMTDRDAARSIVEHNLYGLDIDKRAAQLAYFAVMMKACQYDRRFLRRGVDPHVYCIRDSKSIDNDFRDTFAKPGTALRKDLDVVCDAMALAEEAGSLIVVPEEVDMDALLARAKEMEHEGAFYEFRVQQELLPMLKVVKVLHDRYSVSCTNPPYMSSTNMVMSLSNWLGIHYANVKSDLSSAFMQRCLIFTESCGFMSMINIPVWMFISSYEQLRAQILDSNSYVNMVHPGRGIFGSDFGSVTFVISKTQIPDYIGTYCRLFDEQGEVKSVEVREKEFLSKKGTYFIKQEIFSKIPGIPVAYWASQNIIDDFQKGINITHYIDTFQGIITGDNKKFLRFWFEPCLKHIAFGKHSFACINLNQQYWIPYNKGGDFRNWYGNQEYVVYWKNGPDDKTRGKKSFSNYYLREYVSWSYITSSVLAARYFPAGFLWDVSGSGIFDKSNMLHYLQCLIESKIGIELLKIINPTINYQVENIAQLPVIVKHKSEVDALANCNIGLSKIDWDSYETSWDFQKSSLLPEAAPSKLFNAWEAWKVKANAAFAELKKNEEELNRIFIDIYGLQDELTPEESNKDVTIHYLVDDKKDAPEDMQGSPYLLTKQDAVKQLISYAVGCMFGRYSLDVPGLAYAGGDWDASKYKTFQPDDDNVIPITDEFYFNDDMLDRFEKWLAAVYGADTVTENELFIAQALGKKGTPREIIRKYFLDDFFKDHCKMYQKRPIYWLFDSGKKNGFKALMYLHRYDKNTLGRVSTKYVSPMLTTYASRIKECDTIIQNEPGSADAARARKEKDKLSKQLVECREYSTKISHLAQCYTELDLDDGVKVNYEKVQKDRDGELIPILAKIK